jgi:addiction module RelE/StbE family toxin
MKPIAFSPTFVKKLTLLSRNNPKLTLAITRQLELFQANPSHPSLRTHKLKGNLHNVWSISVTKSFRLVYEQGEKYYFFNLGEHHEIYR